MRIDGFDARVERIGQPIGDALIRLLGTRILEHTGDRGYPARFENDQFAVLVPGPSASETAAETDALRKHIAKRNFSIRGSGAEIGTVTFSCAVCTLKRGESATELLSRTQSLLADALHQGGDIVLS